MGFDPYRTTDEEAEETWDQPAAVDAVFLSLMRSRLCGDLQRPNGIRQASPSSAERCPPTRRSQPGPARSSGTYHDDLLRLVYPTPRTPRRSTMTSWNTGSERWPPRCHGLSARYSTCMSLRPRTAIDLTPELDIPEARGQRRCRGDEIGWFWGRCAGCWRATSRCSGCTAYPRVKGSGEAGPALALTRAASTATGSCGERCSSSMRGRASGAVSSRPIGRPAGRPARRRPGGAEFIPR